MRSSDRRERDFRRREDGFLDLARDLIARHGFGGFSMDRLVEATDYSKGTIYQHFSSKEDLVSALAAQSMQRRVEMFGRALAFDGSTRERMTAVGVAEELFFRLHPSFYSTELVIKQALLETRVSPERTAELHRLERICFTGLHRLAERAVAGGEMTLPGPMQPADVCLGFWSLATGLFGAVRNYAPMLADFGVADPLAGFRPLLQAMFDGLGWKPTTADCDWNAVYLRIEREAFPDEVARVSPAPG